MGLLLYVTYKGVEKRGWVSERGGGDGLRYQESGGGLAVKIFGLYRYPSGPLSLKKVCYFRSVSYGTEMVLKVCEVYYN
jgi:hypothetical protein